MAAPQNGQGDFTPLNTIQRTLTTTKTLGNPDKIQGLVGVYMKGGVSGDVVPFAYEGAVWSVARATQSWAVGQKIYHSSTNTRFQTNATNATLAGFAAAAKANAATQGLVRLCPISA